MIWGNKGKNKSEDSGEQVEIDIPVADLTDKKLSSENDVRFELKTSRQFASWLGEQNVSLAFTTYQAGMLFFLGLNQEGRLTVFNRSLPRCMGLAYHGDSLFASSLYQIIGFEDAAKQGMNDEQYDTLFVPQIGYFTGDLDVHDMAIMPDGNVIFVNTLFSCLAEVSSSHSFKPIWKPPFIDRLAAEDRCHLNGLALANGKAKFVTAVAETNVTDGWREHRKDGGVVMDVDSGESIVSGLSMPHSPRWHSDNLWVLNSGTGNIGFVDINKGSFHSIAFCPGYLRGMSFVNNYAVVGLSKPRENKTFSGLELDDNLTSAKVEPRCGLFVIDLNSGDIVHWLRIEGVINELYDVAVIPNRRSISAVGFKNEEIRRVISIDDW